MRIGQFSESFLPIVDGVSRVVYQYATRLGQMGEECYVIAPMNDTGYRGGFPFDLVDYVGVQLPRHQQYRSGVPTLDGHYTARIQQITLDVLHAHSPFGAGSEALRLAQKRNLPLIATFHSKFYDDFYKVTKSEELAWLGTQYVVEFYRHCDQVWTVSRHAARTLRDYGFLGEPIVVENGVDIREPDDAMARRMAARLELDPGVPVMLYVGQLDWKKNLLRTLQAAAELKRAGRRFYLVMVGQGPDAQEIEAKAKELRIAQELRMPGHIGNDGELFGIYRISDLFVFLSQYDTAGLVVREAATMGTPSLVARGSAPAECIRHNENGLVCDDDTPSVAATLEQYLFAPEELARLGENARATIPQPWEQVVEQVRARYQGLVGAGHKKKRGGAALLNLYKKLKGLLEKPK